MFLRLLSFFFLSGFLLFSSCAPEQPKKKSVKVEQRSSSAEKSPDASKKKQTAKDDNKAKSNEQSSGATPEQLAKAKEIINNVGAKDLAGVDAKKKFKTFCATCHGFKGDLNVNGAKDLTISKISLEESVAQVYHGKGLMTPFKGIMTDAEIVAVAKWIEGLRK